MMIYDSVLDEVRSVLHSHYDQAMLQKQKNIQHMVLTHLSPEAATSAKQGRIFSA